MNLRSTVGITRQDMVSFPLTWAWKYVMWSCYSHFTTMRKIPIWEWNAMEKAFLRDGQQLSPVGIFEMVIQLSPKLDLCQYMSVIWANTFLLFLFPFLSSPPPSESAPSPAPHSPPLSFFIVKPVFLLLSCYCFFY